MPFNLHSPSLSRDAYKVIIDFIEESFSPEKQEQFYEHSGKIKEEWLGRKKRSHGDYHTLIDAFYEVYGERNPELLFSVYKSIGTSKESPVRGLAKLLGNAPAVVEASAYFSGMLNDDSRIKVHSLRASGASIQQTVEGPTEFFYPEQVFGAMGYYKGIAPLFNLKEIEAELRMLSMPLEIFLHQYAAQFVWEKDEEGNFYSQGKLFAKTIPYQQTSLAFLGIPSPLWEMKDGSYFIGSLEKAKSGRKVGLEELLVVETTRALESEGVPFIRGGVFFGGKHPAPTNLYDLRWEAKEGLRQRVWLFLSGLRAEIFESRETIGHMALLADKEAERRDKAEKAVTGLKSELKNRTTEAYGRLQEDIETRELLRLELHDFGHKINGVRQKNYTSYLGWLDIFARDIFVKDQAILSKLNEALACYELPEFLKFLEDPKKNGPANIGTVSYSLLEILQQREDRNEVNILEREITRMDELEKDFEHLEKEIRRMMLGEKGKIVGEISFAELLQRTLEKFTYIGRKVQQSVQIPSDIIFQTNQKRFELLIENLTLNALEAAAEVPGGYLRVLGETQPDGIVTIIENSAPWKSEEQVHDIVQRMQAPGTGFSTKGDIKRTNERGVAQRLIVDTLRIIGAPYVIEGNFSERYLRQKIIFPQEIIKIN
ncbi:MAG: hypothetical protein Q8R18_04805 [bacterium]|nr:hypothetical protein [bacterium]